jgi:hypothetical protein
VSPLFFSIFIHFGQFVDDVLLISLSSNPLLTSDFGTGAVLFSLQEDCHICNIDLNVQYFAV